MVGIGIIGIGFMGYTHFEAARNLNGAGVAAIATRNAKKLRGDWTGIQGNFGPPAGVVDLSGVKTYTDYHDLLADPDVELVDICLPTDRHEEVVVESLAAGKPTLVEKPIAIELDAADRMVEAAEKANLPLMVGHVLPFFPEFRFVADCIDDGEYGRLLSAHFRRMICPPNWSAEMADFRKLGGWGIDLHIHDNHFISLACGVPEAVFSCGLLREGFVNHVHTQYLYDDPELTVSCQSGGIAAAGLQFGHGFEIYLEEATILFDFATLGGEPVTNRPLTFVEQDGSVTTPQLHGGAKWCSAFTAELQDAVEAVRQGRTSTVLSGNLARDALKLCYAEAESITERRTVSLDSVNQ